MWNSNNKPLVVVLSGKAQHGNDTAQEYLAGELSEMGITSERIAFADRLKEQMRWLGWDGVKDERGRRLLQNGSRLLKDYFGENYYAEYAANKAKDSSCDIVFITDCRFRNEMEVVKQTCLNVMTVRIVREQEGWKSSLTEEQQHHPSEIDLDEYQFDKTIKNDGEFQFFANLSKLIPEITTKIDR